MKKFVSIALALVMVLTLAVSAMASGNLYRDGNTWYFDAYEDGILWVKDNKYQHGYHVAAGQNNLGQQSNFTGKLVFVSFEQFVPKPDVPKPDVPKHDCTFTWDHSGVSVGAGIDKKSGNINLCTLFLDKYELSVCECGNVSYELTASYSYLIQIPNNYKGNVDLDGYTVYISTSGNNKINDLYVVW